MKFLKIPETVLEVLKPLDNEVKGRIFSALSAYEENDTEPELEGTEKALWVSIKFLLKKKKPSKAVITDDVITQKTLFEESNGPEGGSPASQETFCEGQERAGDAAEQDVPVEEEREFPAEEPEEVTETYEDEAELQEEDMEQQEQEMTQVQEEQLEKDTYDLYLEYYNKWWDLKNAREEMVPYQFNGNKDSITEWLRAMIKYHGREIIHRCIMECAREGFYISQGFTFEGVKDYFVKNHKRLAA